MDSKLSLQGIVQAVSLSPTHSLQKPNATAIHLLAGLGVEGDAHLGKTVQHLSRIKKDPTQPNIRQVHLIHAELHAELAEKGLMVGPGQMGENITTMGIDLLNLPKGSLLRLGEEAVVEVTGLRNPCHQLNNVQPGLLEACLDRDAAGNLVRKAGIMGIIVQGGTLRPGEAIEVVLPAGEWQALQPV